MLDGKVAIVSGASYGMGYSMAELFAKEGARVVMTARGKEKLDAAVKSIRDQGYDVTGVVADNKNLDDVKKVIQTALDIYGDLDIVINNAAIGEQKMIDETDDEWLEREERIRQIEQEVERLPARTRLVLEQCYYHHRTYREVAAELGITPDGIKKHITNAMKHLRQHFHQEKQKK